MAVTYENKMVGGERLDGIKNSIQKNISCCRYALEEKKRVSILAKGTNTEGIISRLSWDDMEDIVWVETNDGKVKSFSGSQISKVRLL